MAEETPVALVYDGTTQAVMMATPSDLTDFAIGFSLSEQIVSSPAQITRLERHDQPLGVEMRLWLSPEAKATLGTRRRTMAGPVGCGLCGVESLEAALRPLPALSGDTRFDRSALMHALNSMRRFQPLHTSTRATHAAAFHASGTFLLREDIGRHNALDKLIGARARARVGQTCAEGAVLLSSRVSIEMVQKAVLARAPVLVSISRPTALAVSVAQACGLTLACRANGTLEVFTHPERISGGASHVV
nr:formate dehydrogenase accessory sulfurtransferase FdhD [Rhodovulum imhoffii]